MARPQIGLPVFRDIKRTIYPLYIYDPYKYIDISMVVVFLYSRHKCINIYIYIYIWI